MHVVSHVGSIGDVGGMSRTADPGSSRNASHVATTDIRDQITSNAYDPRPWRLHSVAANL